MMLNVRIVFLLIGLLVVGCHSANEDVKPEGIRIVSMSPGITNTLIDAGFSNYLVGRSPFCHHANQSIPVVGDLRDVDFERLLKMTPSHVFVQQTSSGIDEHLLALSTQGKFELHAWPMDRLEDIKTLYRELTGLLGGSQQILEFSPLTTVSFQSPVLVISPGLEGSAGLSFGTETYIDDLLQGMGIDNVLHQSGWISLSLEDIGRLNPKSIIVVSDNEIAESTLTGLRSLGYPVIPFVHEHVLVPSSYIANVANKFQELNFDP